MPADKDLLWLCPTLTEDIYFVSTTPMEGYQLYARVKEERRFTIDVAHDEATTPETITTSFIPGDL